MIRKKVTQILETYSEILADSSFLNVRRNANQIGEVSIYLDDYEEKIIRFVVPSQYGNGTYDVRVQILDLIGRVTDGMTAAQINRLILDSDLRVSCTDPSFLYWGFQYISNVQAFGLAAPVSYPEIRNPNLRGKGCKHIHRALQIYSFSVNTIRNLLV